MEKYTQGTDMTQFKRIEEISRYNYNYYVGFGKDLLLAISDDDDETEWYIETGNLSFRQIGISYTSDGDTLET